MQRKINGFATVGLLIIIILVLAVAGGAFYLSRSASTSSDSSGAQGTYTEPTFGFTLSYPLSVGINVNESLMTGFGQSTVSAKFHSPQQNNPVLVTVTSSTGGNDFAPWDSRGTIMLNGVRWVVATSTMHSVNARRQESSYQVVTATSGIPGKYSLELSRMVGTEGLDADLSLMKNIAASVIFPEADVQAVNAAAQELDAQRSTANIAAIRSGLDMIQTIAAIYKNSHGNYGVQVWASGAATACTNGIFSDSTVINMLQQADTLNGSGNIDCYASRTSFLVATDLTKLSGSNSWGCVDSAGTYRVESSAFPTTAPAGYLCP